VGGAGGRRGLARHRLGPRQLLEPDVTTKDGGGRLTELGLIRIRWEVCWSLLSGDSTETIQTQRYLGCGSVARVRRSGWALRRIARDCPSRHVPG
jgi:hypothetical protein